MIVNNIDTKDITLVVQGAINEKYTSLCLKSFREYLPDATIILSTWEGSDVNDLDYDEIILNKDPGSFLYDSKSLTQNNIDRQITSTINGLKKVKTKYAFKIRTDFKLNGNSFLNYFNIFDKYDNEHKIVSKRILVCTNATRNPENLSVWLRFPFHISDFAFFGLTEDLIDLFDIPLTPEEDKEYHINYNKENIIVSRFVPEQHILINFLKKHKNIDCRHRYDNSKENIELTKLYITNNFVLLNLEQFCFLPFKKEFLTRRNIIYLQSCFTHYDFLKMYKKYCDGNYSLPYFDYERKNLEIYIFYRRIKRAILKPFINIICWFILNRKLKHKIRSIYN